MTDDRRDLSKKWGNPRRRSSVSVILESIGKSQVDPFAPALGILDEGGLSRALMHIGKGGFALITAFRGQHDLDTNRSRNRQLLSTLNSHKLGPILTTGHWEEAPVGMDWKVARSRGITKGVVEDSFLVPKPANMSMEDFEKILHAAGNLFDQDAILIGEENEAWLLFKGGGREHLGSLNMGKIAEGYAFMRGNPCRRFAFEGMTRPAGAYSAIAFRVLGLSWVGYTILSGEPRR